MVRIGRSPAAAASLEAMEVKLGPYPYRDFFIVEVPSDLVTWSGASQQGMIFATSDVFGYNDGNLALFAHEMGHGHAAQRGLFLREAPDGGRADGRHVLVVRAQHLDQQREHARADALVL